MKNVFHMALVPLLLGLVVPAGCSTPESTEPGQPSTNVSSTARDVTLPANVQSLRDRIKTNLEEIARTCKQHKITPQQIRNSLYATNWDDPKADRLAKMPQPVRQKMKQVRDDFIKHNKLVVAAYDEAEGRELVEEVKK